MSRDSSETEILEFGVFHWILGSDTSLPGVTGSGMPDPEFFAPLTKSPVTRPESISEWLETCLPNWVTKAGGDPLILCSGGVDSSLIVAAASRAGSSCDLIHTAYVQHNNNDLYKLFGVLEYFPSLTRIASISAPQYLSGLELLWKNRIPQNTYGPTIAFALNAFYPKTKKILVTGIGPDEFFYGMEKYPYDHFQAKEQWPVAEALESIDTPYNLNAYRQVLSRKGEEVLDAVISKRKRLYTEIAAICDSIYDAQRLLAYCTVTAQHESLFSAVAGMMGTRHFAPFLDPELIKTVFSIPVRSLLDPDGETSRVEIGKYHFKKYLAELMPDDHVWSKKIGFHAPTTSFMHAPCFRPHFENIDYDVLPAFLDKGKVKALINDRLMAAQGPLLVDYFLYSILNLNKLNSLMGSRKHAAPTAR